MSGFTSRTQNYLLTNEFQDGQPAGSISPQDMRDVIGSVPSFSTLFNVKNFGAIGNGSSNPASSVYGSLAALRAVYGTTISGVTVALTQEIDWLATQLAINTAAATNGSIYSPNGTYVYSNSSSVADGSGQLKFPMTTDADYTGGVSWRGDMPGSIHSWPIDLGSGKAAIVCGDRTQNSSGGMFWGITLTGPGVGTTLGSKTSNMAGIMTNDRRIIEKVNILGFNQGINLIGGQCIHRDINITACYDGYYWDNANPNQHSNMHFERVVINSCMRSCIAVHQATPGVSDSTYLNCFFGTTPFSVYKETNSGSPTSSLITYGTTFINTQFEAFGNAMLCDDTAAPANRVCQVYNTRFLMCQISQDPGYKIAAKNYYAAIDIGTSNGMYIDGISEPFLCAPGATSWISIQGNIGTTISADLVSIFANCTVTPFAAGDWDVYSGWVEQNNIGAFYWRGQVINQSGLAANNVIVSSGGQGAAASAGSGTEVPLGVVQYVAPSGNLHVFAYTGYVVAKTSGTVTANTFARTGASGAAITTGTTNSILGVAISTAGSNLWNVILRGLR